MGRKLNRDNEVVRTDGSINAKALFENIVKASALTQPEIEADVRSKVEELSALRAEIRGFTGRNQAIEDGQKEQD